MSVEVMRFCVARITKSFYRRRLLGVLAVIVFCTFALLIRLPTHLVYPINYFDTDQMEMNERMDGTKEEDELGFNFAASNANTPLKNAAMEKRKSHTYSFISANDIPQRYVASFIFQENDEPQPIPEPLTIDTSYTDRVRTPTDRIHFKANATSMNFAVKNTTKKCFHFSSEKHGNLCVESILGDEKFSLDQKLQIHAKASELPKMILSLEGEITQSNLGACPDWNCRVMDSYALKLEQADAIVIRSISADINYRYSHEQYIVYYNQEAYSYMNSQLQRSIFNLTMNFLRRSPISSPYGYAVKLAPLSHGRGELVNEERVRTKNKAIAWFVSNCITISGREMVIYELKRYINVDIYGGCGKMQCEKGGECEERLNTEYHFYAAFENTNCEDYITEKLWRQGFEYDVIPLVLKRNIVHRYVPPYSFIAVDDFRTIREMAEYLSYLMRNKTAYMEYFAWRKDYAVIYLDGLHHDELERPWGLCQLCRLLWEQPRPHYELSDEYDTDC